MIHLSIFSKYYAMDWLGSIFALLAVYSLGEKKRIGFHFGILSNVFWLVFAYLSSSVGLLASQIGFLILNTAGLIKWKKTPSTK